MRSSSVVFCLLFFGIVLPPIYLFLLFFRALLSIHLQFTSKVCAYVSAFFSDRFLAIFCISFLVLGSKYRGWIKPTKKERMFLKRETFSMKKPTKLIANLFLWINPLENLKNYSSLHNRSEGRQKKWESLRLNILIFALTKQAFIYNEFLRLLHTSLSMYIHHFCIFVQWLSSESSIYTNKRTRKKKRTRRSNAQRQNCEKGNR